MTASDFYSALTPGTLPPVERWNPEHCGDSAMRIAADGTWFHEGARIARPALVRLFAGLLRKDADGFVLVTPVEKLRIKVEDAPFLAVALRVEDAGPAQRLIFTTNVGDEALLGPGHGLRLAVPLGGSGDPIPYIHVRGGLEAKVARPVWYQLAELAVCADEQLGVWSMGCFFALGPRA